MAPEQLDKLIQDRILSMYDENSPKLMQFFLRCAGKQMHEADADELEISAEMNITKDKRYKVKAIFTIDEI